MSCESKSDSCDPPGCESNADSCDPQDYESLPGSCDFMDCESLPGSCDFMDYKDLSRSTEGNDDEGFHLDSRWRRRRFSPRQSLGNGDEGFHLDIRCPPRSTSTYSTWKAYLSPHGHERYFLVRHISNLSCCAYFKPRITSRHLCSHSCSSIWAICIVPSSFEKKMH